MSTGSSRKALQFFPRFLSDVASMAVDQELPTLSLAEVRLLEQQAKALIDGVPP